MTDGWTARVALLEGKLAAAARLQLRFVVADELPESGAVEAAIDDVELLSLPAECQPDAGAPGPGGGDAGPSAIDGADGGCSCRSAARPSAATPWILLAVAGALVILRRRRGGRAG